MESQHDSRRRIPERLVALAITIVVVILGAIDCATGDYSMLVFYMAPVSVGAWFLEARFGLTMAVFSGFVRLCADYSTYAVFTYGCAMNIVKDTSFFIMISLMTMLIRRMLESDGRVRR